MIESNNNHHHVEQKVELLKIWEIILRRKWLIIIIFVTFMGIVVLGTHYKSPVYDAKAKILIESSDSLNSLMANIGLKAPGSTTKSGSATAGTYYDTDIAMATIRPVCAKVITSLGLEGRDGEALKPEKLAPGSTFGWVKNVYILPQPYIEVDQHEDADILEIASYSTDPNEAANMSNELARFYIEDRLEQKRKEYTGARLFIQQEIENVRKKYEAFLAEKKAFMLNENIANLDAETKNLLEYRKDLLSEFRARELKRASNSAEFTEEAADVVALKKELEILAKLVAATEKELMRIPQRIVTDSEIGLNLSVYQTMYETLLEYLTQVGIAESMTMSDVRLVEPAIIAAKPFFPNKNLNYIMGVFLGAFLAFSLAFLREYVDRTMRSSNDLEAYGLTFLGSIPEYRRLWRKRLITNTDANDPVYEAHLGVLSSVRFAGLDKAHVKMAVSSIEPEGGCTTVVANLGIAWAMEGRKVLLVDTDMRRSHLHRLFGVSNKVGLCDALLENLDINEVIVDSQVDGLSILPAGKRPPDAALLLKSDKIRDLIGELEEKYDVIIFDSAPLAIKNDAILLMDYSDGMILVSRSGATTYPAISKVTELLKKSKVTPTGTVLNQF